ncbi:YIP1 family protein [Rhodosalinus sp.]|uniref:YIP1 family protein n=1 Tax=Rhodosalinus sp. TaxID=2047741 RepID=UPI003564295B
MPVTTDIAATYRSPRAVMRRLLAAGRREDRALAILMGGCLLAFIGRWPALQRAATLETDAEGPSFEAMMAGALFGWIFVAPLLFYGLAALSHLVARALGGQGGFFGARLALFWSFLAAAPLLLLHGLVEGFVGPGPGLQIVGVLWLVAFGWFWIASLREAEKGMA